jgi:hypothetical protein
LSYSELRDPPNYMGKSLQSLGQAGQGGGIGPTILQEHFGGAQFIVTNYGTYLAFSESNIQSYSAISTDFKPEWWLTNPALSLLIGPGVLGHHFTAKS